MSEQIRNRIDDAGNKEMLETIGREMEPSIELDRRKNMEVLRAELHAHLDEQQDTDSGQETADVKKTEPKQEKPDKTQKTEPKGVRPKGYEGRLLQNMTTGAVFPWTAALAKKRNMREV